MGGSAAVEHVVSDWLSVGNGESLLTAGLMMDHLE